MGFKKRECYLEDGCPAKECSFSPIDSSMVRIMDTDNYNIKEIEPKKDKKQINFDELILIQDILEGNLDNNDK